MKKHILAAVFLSSVWSAPAVAGTQDFTVLNNTGYQIDELYVAASTKDDWEEDVLGRDTLANSDRTKIRFDSEEEACLWDMKVKYEDGETAEWQGINLCEISVVKLSYDDASGRTWAEAE